jgi:amidase
LLARVSDEQYRHACERAKTIPTDDDSLVAVGLRAGIATHRDWLQANESRARLGHRWHRFFLDWDVVVCPSSPTVSFPHNAKPMEVRTLSIDGVEIPYFDQIAWPSLATASGLPATTVPFGRTVEDLPTGVEVIGPYMEDPTTLAFAEHLERHFGGFIPPPAFIT